MTRIKKYKLLSRRTCVLVGLVLVYTFAFLFARQSKQREIKVNPPILSSYPALSEQRKALANKPTIQPLRVLDSSQIVDDMKFLSSPECEGRAPGTKGHATAITLIIKRMRESGLDSLAEDYTQFFKGRRMNGSKEGKNVLGYVRGTTMPDEFIVISAHYDHVGVNDGKIYPGASDNASGTAALLALAKYFRKNPAAYSLLFIAFDREESGLEGSRYFVENPPLKKESIKFNLNIDMIARNEQNEIFICGVRQQPGFRSIVENAQKQTNARLLMGHDGHEQGRRNNWVSLSDHFPFYQKGIPFLYLGVEDHPDYHQPTDTWEKFDLSEYIENCNLVVTLIKEIHAYYSNQKSF